MKVKRGGVDDPTSLSIIGVIPRTSENELWTRENGEDEQADVVRTWCEARPIETRSRDLCRFPRTTATRVQRASSSLHRFSQSYTLCTNMSSKITTPTRIIPDTSKDISSKKARKELDKFLVDYRERNSRQGAPGVDAAVAAQLEKLMASLAERD
jgi:hypothetical protein